MYRNMHSASDSSHDDDIVQQHSSLDAMIYNVQNADMGTHEPKHVDNDDENDASNIDTHHPNHPWFYQPQYNRFWQHYTAMQSWMQSYVTMHRNRYPPISYQHMMNRLYNYPHSTIYQHNHPFSGSASPSWNFNSQRTAEQYRDSVPHYHNDSAQSRSHYHDNSECKEQGEYSDEETGRSSDESMEIEMSQEMIDFFKTSQKFREERDKAKKAQATSEEKKATGSKKKWKNHGKEKDTSDCRAPVERPDEGRRKGMKVLYGKHSARIHGMETAIQMQFDRNCDRFQPAFWPIVALKM